MKFAPVFAALALLWPAAALAFDIGPAVGSKVPALHAMDVAGHRVKLADVSGKNGVVLMFFRSAKWCPFCQKQLMEFRDAQAPLEARGYKLVALSYDPPEVLTGFAAQRQVSYTLLSDPGSVTIDAFKLRDAQYKPDSFAYGVPMPAIFVLSPKGVVQAKLAEEGYKVRPSVQAVLEAVDKVKRQG
jgi:peroxiredoxin